MSRNQSVPVNPVSAAETVTIPPTIQRLESGDLLTRAQFEQRYDAMPLLKKAELIGGIVYVGSPVRQKKHARPHAIAMTWLGNYFAATPKVDIGDNATVRLDEENEVQPDAFLRFEVGGNSRVSVDDYVEGAPELVIEIASSSASYDLHFKKKLYQRFGVREYAVWCPEEHLFYWFRLNERGRYTAVKPDSKGVIRSRVFPGLWLDVEALLAGDAGRVVNMARLGLASPEHAAFLND